MARTRPETTTLHDLLTNMNLLPDDNPADTALFRAVIMADLAPQGVFEKVVAGNIADIEIERERLKRWIGALVKYQTWGRIKRGFRLDVMGEEAVAALDQEWESGGGNAVTKVLKEHRGDFTYAVVQVWVDIAAHIGPSEIDLRNGENRRHKMLRDDKMLQDNRRPAIPDAELAN